LRVNRTELAEVLGVSMPTITAWLGEGMPYVEGGGKGKPFVFDTVECDRMVGGKQAPRKRGACGRR
jgi:phage terminase Nu1 subunit (DNA packaging protein)